jgi:hypothetical protein
MSTAERDESATPTWQMGRDRYQALRGVKRPHIAEISPVQYALMGKRAKAAYDVKRHAEWQASADCAAEYARECVEAFIADPSILDSASLHYEAREQIQANAQRVAKQEREQSLAAAHQSNRLSAGDVVSPGDRLWSLLHGRYVVVAKASKLSFRTTDGVKVNVGACLRLKHDDLVAAVAS